MLKSISYSAAMFLGIALFLLPLSGDVQGAGAEVKVQAEAQTSISAPLDTSEELEGLVFDTIDTAPSALGLWWRGVREQISLGLTSDPVQKAEKRVQFAEERVHIAQLIAEKSNDPEVQAQVEKMMQRAHDLVIKIETEKDAWVSNSDERTTRLLRNIAAHHIRRERVFDNIEQGLPEERQEQFAERRERLRAGSERLLRAIDNENIPEEVRRHLQSVRERIEAKVAAEKEFRTKRKELLDSAKVGDQSAQEKLRMLREDRQKTMERIRESFKDTQLNIRSDVKGVLKDAQAKIQNRQDTQESERPAAKSPAVRALQRAKEVQQKALDRKVQIQEELEAEASAEVSL